MTKFPPYITAASVLVCLFFVSAVRADNMQKILVLNSHHRGFSWSDDIMNGIESEFEQTAPDVQLFFEYLDSSRYDPNVAFSYMEQLCRFKYKDFKFDVIICSDNNALEFLRLYRDKLFPNTPVVFCGINGFEDSMIAGLDLVTGIIEVYDKEAAIEVALKLHPHAREVVLVTNQTWDYLKGLPFIIRKFEARTKLINLEVTQMTVEEFLDKISKIGNESIVLLPYVLSDSKGNEYTDELIQKVFHLCAAPMYTNSFQWIGSGVVGGNYNKGTHHGQIVAGMAIRILKGENVRNIPIAEGANDYRFDYNQLERFGISLSQLPPRSTVINEPKSFYYRHKKQIWAVSAAIASLMAIILILSANILRRKRAEKELRKSESKYRTLVENLPQKVFLKDKTSVYVSCNKAYARDLKIIPEEIAGKTDYDFYPVELAEKYRTDDKRIIKSGRTEDIEEKYVQNGREVVVHTVKIPVRDERGDVVGLLGIFWDISERKQAERKLLDYQVQLKSLASELSLAEERERRRIAVELHDRISQSLVISKAKLETLRENASSDDDLAGVLDEVCSWLDQTIQSTRLLTFDLSSPILHELGFEAAVSEWLDEQIGEKHGIATEFEDDGKSKPLEDDVRVLLFRDVRELLINVVKHAGARKVKVSVRRVGGRIRIGIEDDGVGFDPAKVALTATKTGGFGLFSIRERLEQLGGHLEIKSKVGCGTKVTVIAPLKS